MSRQRRTPGAIVKIDLDGGYHTYAQILDKSMVFFDIRTKEEFSTKELKVLLDTKILFFCSVFDSVITSGHWLKVGKLPIREELQILPMKFIQDKLNRGVFELYDPNTGEITPSTYEECKGLECAAVWEAEHVESRLNDHFNGVENEWLKTLEPKI